MTVREKTARASPDQDVLFIEDFRDILSTNHDDVGAAKTSSSSTLPPEIILLGHDMSSDFGKMREAGIDLGRFIKISGCLDTHVVVEDNGSTVSKSLSGLMDHYHLCRHETIEHKIGGFEVGIHRGTQRWKRCHSDADGCHCPSNGHGNG